MTSYGFFNAVPFLRRHFPQVPEMAACLDHLDRLIAEGEGEFDKIRTTGAWLYAMFHERTAEVHDDLLYCSFCAWGQHRVTALAEDTGS